MANFVRVTLADQPAQYVNTDHVVMVEHNGLKLNLTMVSGTVLTLIYSTEEAAKRVKYNLIHTGY